MIWSGRSFSSLARKYASREYQLLAISLMVTFASSVSAKKVYCLNHDLLRVSAFLTIYHSHGVAKVNDRKDLEVATDIGDHFTGVVSYVVMNYAEHYS